MKKKNPATQAVDQIGSVLSDIKNKKKITDAALVYEALKPIEEQINALYDIHKSIERSTANEPAETIELSAAEQSSVARLKAMTEQAEIFQLALEKRLKQKTDKSKKNTPQSTSKKRQSKFKALGSDEGWLPL